MYLEKNSEIRSILIIDKLIQTYFNNNFNVLIIFQEYKYNR